MIHFDPLSFLLGAVVSQGVLFVSLVIRDAWRKHMGHHRPIKAEKPKRDNPREAVLIASARKIVEQGGSCSTPVYVNCEDCPAHIRAPCTQNWGDGDCVPWFKEYLASHESLRHRPKK